VSEMSRISYISIGISLILLMVEYCLISGTLSLSLWSIGPLTVIL
jgi:hypothetical protein